MKQELKKGKRPIVLLIDLLGKKWLMRILWELREDCCTFRELQQRCGNISPTIVNKRIKELVDANLVQKTKPSGYRLTELGRELLALFNPVNAWTQKWSESF